MTTMIGKSVNTMNNTEMTMEVKKMNIQFMREKKYVTTKVQRTYLYKFAEIIGHNKIEVVPIGGNPHGMPRTDFRIGKFRVMGEQDDPHTWYLSVEDGCYTPRDAEILELADRLYEGEDEDGELVLYIM